MLALPRSKPTEQGDWGLGAPGLRPEALIPRHPHTAWRQRGKPQANGGKNGAVIGSWCKAGGWGEAFLRKSSADERSGYGGGDT